MIAKELTLSRRGFGRRFFGSAAAIVAGLLLSCCALPDSGEPPPVGVLAPTGVLRAALYPGTPTSILEAEATSSSRGVGYELGRELARRLGVPYRPIVFAKNAEVLEAVKSGAVDVAFTNASPERAKDMDFSRPYLDLELGYLVAAGRPIGDLAEIDRPGQRIGVTAHSSSDAALSVALKRAQVVRAQTVGVGEAMLADGRIDAFATNKATLFEMAGKLPGARVLDGLWGLERHGIAIPKGRAQALSYLNDFAAEMKASGFVRQAAERAGLRGIARDEQASLR